MYKGIFPNGIPQILFAEFSQDQTLCFYSVISHNSDNICCSQMGIYLSLIWIHIKGQVLILLFVMT